MSHEPIIEIVHSFLMSDDFTDSCESFAIEKSKLFDPDSEENKLVYHDVYLEYQKMLEDKIEGFVKEKGVPLEKFYEALEEDHENGEGTAEFLQAMTDFAVFISMMKDVRRSILEEGAE